MHDSGQSFQVLKFEVLKTVQALSDRPAVVIWTKEEQIQFKYVRHVQ